MKPFKNIHQFLFLSTALLTLQSGFSQKGLSTLESSLYDSKTNTTEYIALPLGSVSLPGLWTKHHYNSISAQQFFTNKDSVITAIAFTKCNMYEFSKKNLKDYAFLKVYYEWDSKYLAEKQKMTREIIQSDSINQFIVWRIFNNAVETYYLYGNKNCSVHNFSVITNKWTGEQKAAFLKELYLKKKAQ